MFQHAWSHLFVTGDELPNVLLRVHELNDGDQLFQRQQYGIVPELLPDAAEPESDWDMHDADAPDDENAGQETPVLAQVEIQAKTASASEHRRLLHHRPLQHKKRLLN